MNKKEKQQKLINIVKRIGFGAFALPITFIVFTVDRLLLVCLPHIHGRTFKNWLEASDSVLQSILRIVAVSGVYGVLELFKWIF
jgi:hypothetical protein